MTRNEFETALDAGQLEVQMTNGRWWRVRRNGRTKTWKRDTSRFATPCKAGLRECFTVDQFMVANQSPTLRVAPA